MRSTPETSIAFWLNSIGRLSFTPASRRSEASTAATTGSAAGTGLDRDLGVLATPNRPVDRSRRRDDRSAADAVRGRAGQRGRGSPGNRPSAYLPGGQGTSTRHLHRPRRSPPSRRAARVGDVAGESGACPLAVRGLGARRLGPDRVGLPADPVGERRRAVSGHLDRAGEHGRGVARLAEAWGDFRIEVDEYRALDEERVLRWSRPAGGARRAAWNSGRCGAQGACAARMGKQASARRWTGLPVFVRSDSARLRRSRYSFAPPGVAGDR